MLPILAAATFVVNAAAAVTQQVVTSDPYALGGDCSQDGLIWDCAKNGLVWTQGALRMNQIQVVGTHNSYHIEPPKAERDLQSAVAPSAADLQYSHAALDIQLEHLHVRNLELDLLADPDGGEYSQPLIRRLAGLGVPDDPALKFVNTKVLHIPDVDYHTTCSTLVGCLQIIKRWMGAHPDSVPLPIMIEFKTAQSLGQRLGGSRVITWDNTTLLDVVDAEIRSVFSKEQLITPDDIRRGGLTLEQSVLTHGWPDLDSARGRIFFLMDNGPINDVRDAYNAGRPNLEGRVLFTNSAPGEADCAFQKLNEATTEADVAYIQHQVKSGYWVRTVADEPFQTITGESCSVKTREAAFRSGAQIVTTDFPVYGMSARWDCDYAVRLPGGKAARCNPVNGPKICEGGELEPAEYTSN